MRPSMVIAAVDFSVESDRAARLAASFAARHGSRLALIHVDSPPLLATVAIEPVYFPPQWLDSLRGRHDHEVRGKLAWLSDRLLDANPGLAIETHVVLDEPIDGISRAAREHAAGLVVMATRGASASRFLLGSIAAGVAAGAPCPVLIVGPGDEPLGDAFRRVLCGIDYSPLSRAAAQVAADFAEPDARVELVHVWHEPRLSWLKGHPEREQVFEAGMAHARTRLAAFIGELEAPRYQPHVASGGAAGALLDRAEAIRSDLIVVGAHGREGTARVLGTVADRVIRHAPCPVLVVPASAAIVGAVSPSQGAAR